MDMYYETDRLILRILNESSAADALAFHQKNKAVFEPCEPDRPENFYTLEYQSALLNCEFQLALKMTSVRFWFFRKDEPDRIIGTVSFQDVLRSVYQTCHIGYKLDSDFWHQGYAREGVAKAIEIVAKEFELHRFEALVQAENKASIRLLEALGFSYEGISKSCVYLRSTWVDHLRYSFIAP